MNIRLVTESNEKAIKVAAKLYECRDLAKLVLGDRYADTMLDYGKKLKEIASKTGQSELRVAQEWAESYFAETRKSETVTIIMAAAVELFEPSKAAS